MADGQAGAGTAPAHGPLAPMRAALQSAQRDLGGRLAIFARDVQHHVGEAQQAAGRAVQHLGRRVLAQQTQRPGALSMLAVSGPAHSLPR